MPEFIQNLDWAVLNWIQKDMTSPLMDAIMFTVTSLANGGIIFFITAGIMLLIKKYRRCGANILLCMAIGAVVANLILKPLIARERPCWSNEDVELLVAMPQDFSFPSGHTLHSVMVAVVIFMYDKRIGSLAIIMAVLISFSRLYLYVHFPSDVLCGALLGAAFAVAGYYLIKLIVSKSEKLQELFPEGKSE